MKQNKAKPRKWNLHKFIWLILLLLIPFGFLLKELLHYHSLRERFNYVRQKNQEMRNKIELFESERDKLRNAEPEIIERQAREQLKYAKPGEVILVPEN